MDSPQEREDWILAIRSVAEQLKMHDEEGARASGSLEKPKKKVVRVVTLFEKLFDFECFYAFILRK